MTQDHHFILFGGEGKVEYGGVGFVVDKRLKPAIKAAWAISPRIAAIRVATAPRDITLVSVYVPQSGRPYEERLETLEALADL
eukprot:4843532-Alexandrium_andersonii.AAC.1